MIATLVGGGSAFSAAPSSSAVRARQSRHMMTATGQGGRDAAELPTSRKDVIGAVFGAVAASSFAFVAAADAKVCVFGVFACLQHHLFVWPVGTLAGPEALPRACTTMLR